MEWLRGMTKDGISLNLLWWWWFSVYTFCKIELVEWICWRDTNRTVGMCLLWYYVRAEHSLFFLARKYQPTVNVEYFPCQHSKLLKNCAQHNTIHFMLLTNNTHFSFTFSSLLSSAHTLFFYSVACTHKKQRLQARFLQGIFRMRFRLLFSTPQHEAKPKIANGQIPTEKFPHSFRASHRIELN